MAFLDAKTGDLVTHWKTQAGVTALVGATTSTRAYPEYAKEEASLPLIVYSVAQGGQAPRALSGGLAVRFSIVNVWCFDSTRAGADALAESVRQATENYRGVMGSSTVYDCRASAPDTGAAPHNDGSQAKDYWCRIVYEIVHSVTAA
jgi:hypothetical protein